MSSISSGGLLTLNTVTPLAGNITLTSNDGSVIFTPGAGTLNLMATGSGGSGITTIDGDVSSVTGSTVTITGGTSGAVFTGDGTTTMTQSFNHLSLPDSTSDSLGVVYINSVPFMHAYPGTASNNVFVGENAGNFTVSGTDIVGVGNAALASLSSGGANACIGNQSGTLIDTGSENVALGHVSLVSATSANQQTAIGCNALAGVVSGIYNTALGFDSGGNYTGSESYNICINATGVVGDMNVLRIGIGGDIGGGDVTTAYIGGIAGNAPGSGDGLVYVNSSTGQMSAAQDVSLPDSTNASTGTINIGGATFMHAIPGIANMNSFVGSEAGGFSNISMLSGNLNTGTGFRSMYTLSSGTQNSGFGAYSLNNIDEGSTNLALGYFSGTNYTGGESGNILLASSGVTGESTTMRLGDDGGITATYIGGISGNVPGAGDEIVYINTTTGQMSSAAAGSFGISSWVDATAATQQMDPGVGYSANAPADVVVFTLPASATIGSQIIVTGSGSFGWQILQNSGQTVYFGSVSTTTGASGSLTSTNGRDVVYLRCVVADNDWQVESSIGNITYA